MIENKLEIIIITYNRDKDLENTFKQLLKSPFVGCKFTVLDNHSDDNTPNLCVKYQKLFPNIKIVRHKRNIGGNANILKAVETAQLQYTWILCDDDNFDFSDCSDVMESIESEKYDIISPGSPGEYEWERGLSTNVRELINSESRYFRARSFIPGTIFKTELYDSFSLIQGYANIHNFFPHFPFINKSLENNFSIYLSKNMIVHAGTHNLASFSALSFIAGWTNSCLLIKDKKIRKETIYNEIYNSSLYNSSFLKRIFLAIILSKLSKDKAIFKEAFYLLYSIILAFGISIDVLIIFPIFIMTIIPRLLYAFIIRCFLYFKYSIKNEEIPEYFKHFSSEDVDIDPLRKF